MSKVLVTINGLQTLQEMSERMDITVVGDLQRQDDNYILTYSDDECDAATDTSICVDPCGTVSMMKSGREHSEMVFQASKVFSSFCETPVGRLDMTVFPTLVEAEMQETEGRIDLEYVIGIAGSQIVNQLHFSYTKDES